MHKIAQMQLSCRQFGDASRLRSHPHHAVGRPYTVHEIAAQRSRRTLCGPAFYLPMAYDVYTGQCSGQHAAIGCEGQRRHEIVRQRACVSRVPIGLQPSVRHVEALIGGKPQLAAFPHDVEHQHVSRTSHRRRHGRLAQHVDAARRPSRRQSSHPSAVSGQHTQSFDISQWDIGRQMMEIELPYRLHRALVVESQRVDVVAGGYPYIALPVATHPHRPLLENRPQLLVQLPGSPARHALPHRLQVDHVGIFVERHPQAAVPVFTDVATIVALDRHARMTAAHI